MTVLHAGAGRNPAGQDEGESRKRAAHRLLEAHRDVLVRRGRRALLEHLLHHGVATIDDVRAAVRVPPGISPKLFGSVPGPLADARIIRPDGYARTTRPEAHARPVQVWRLADRAAAEDWLRRHPDIRDAIRSVLDMDRLAAEQTKEAEEARWLVAYRKQVQELLRDCRPDPGTEGGGG